MKTYCGKLNQIPTRQIHTRQIQTKFEFGSCRIATGRLNPPIRNSFRFFRKHISAAVFLLLFSFSAHALSPETRLSNEALEQRAMNLFLQVRCLICGGQVIENSNTEFSFEMRKLIRQKLSAGKSDLEIKTELKKEFGEDILTEPSSKNGGFLLWLLPMIFAAVAAAAIFRFNRK